MHKKVYVAPCNMVINMEAFELMAVSGNEGSFDVSDEITEDDAVMSNIDRNSGKGNLWEQGW
jgi:hypothetical protein